ncbi:DUF554 domain-containing protein [Caldifermentibacillus hisashii]|jgi:hypothetical protein|uniref:DUF554 domain-containing protein n=1 Tax=Caldifermentibacillus hisashii TaxID=996558 RepID=UPI0031FE0EEC
MLPIGPSINMLAILIGGFLGAFFQKKIPDRLTKAMPLTFGVAAMTMGVNSIIQIDSLPPVILSLLIGSALGELIRLEKGIEWFAKKVKTPVERLIMRGNRINVNDEFMQNFVALFVLFSFSGTGVFGSLNEGMTGVPSLLISKAFLDLFTAAIFAKSLGYMVMTIAFPQIIVMLSLYYSASFILPFIEPFMLNNFSAVGGVIMLATGFRIAGIKNFPIGNMLPALFISMPISKMWEVLFF